jgi:predicted Zn-dependent protease with MMP-like domain
MIKVFFGTLIALWAVILVGCRDEGKSDIVIAPEVTETIQEIQLEAAKRDIILDLSQIDIIMVREFKRKATIAVCKSEFKRKRGSMPRKARTYLKKTIQIKKSTWDLLSNKEKYTVLIHEIGHCYYGLEHVEDDLNFMYKYMLKYADILIFWNLLNDRFFERVKN